MRIVAPCYPYFTSTVYSYALHMRLLNVYSISVRMSTKEVKILFLSIYY